MPLAVSITSVQLAGPQGIKVSGSGSPDGASISVHINMNDSRNAYGATIVGQGVWATTCMIQVSTGQSGTANVTATDPVQNPGQSATDSKVFTL
jgi:hypothetical protein